LAGPAGRGAEFRQTVPLMGTRLCVVGVASVVALAPQCSGFGWSSIQDAPDGLTPAARRGPGERGGVSPTVFRVRVELDSRCARRADARRSPETPNPRVRGAAQSRVFHSPPRALPSSVPRPYFVSAVSSVPLCFHSCTARQPHSFAIRLLKDRKHRGTEDTESHESSPSASKAGR
jgi:hypothetical protein